MAWTKDERRAYDRARYHKRRAILIAQLGVQCAECGSTERLELDHRDRTTKSFDVSTMWTRPLAQIREELTKCQLLCKKCHKKKSTDELRSETPHGTISGYYHRKCRCDECRKAYSIYRKARRASGKETSQV